MHTLMSLGPLPACSSPGRTDPSASGGHDAGGVAAFDPAGDAAKLKRAPVSSRVSAQFRTVSKVPVRNAPSVLSQAWDREALSAFAGRTL